MTAASPTASSSSAPPVAEALLRAWIAELIATPGLTAITDPALAWERHVEEALALVSLLAGAPEGPIVDVGAGGGSVGLPLAVALPGREVVLIEAERRKCQFLESWAARLPNVRVVWGRSEEQATDWAAVAVAKALAPPPIAVEWLLPLVVPGGLAVLFVGPSAEAAKIATVAALVAGEVVAGPRGLAVLRKTGPTPPGFPRRAGVARKRPLA